MGRVIDIQIKSIKQIIEPKIEDGKVYFVVKSEIVKDKKGEK